MTTDRALSILIREYGADCARLTADGQSAEHRLDPTDRRWVPMGPLDNPDTIARLERYERRRIPGEAEPDED